MLNIQELGLRLIADNISKGATIIFNDDWFTFYFDDSGQRGHYIIPYIRVNNIIPDHYVVKRVLKFVNMGDEGKDKAILGVLNLKKCNVVSITENSVIFESFKIVLNNNHWTNSDKFEYI
jgi:hypothetical protein